MQKCISKLTVLPDRLTLFVLTWSGGFSLGLFYGSCSSGVLSDYLSTAAAAPVSMGILLAALPVILCLAIDYYSLHYLLFPISFLKAFLDGLILMAAGAAFGSGLWIIYWPLFFTDRCMNLLFLWLSARILADKNEGYHTPIPLILATIITAVFIDCFLISPWLHRLLL